MVGEVENAAGDRQDLAAIAYNKVPWQRSICDCNDGCVY
jgi:hypothetical protein